MARKIYTDLDTPVCRSNLCYPEREMHRLNNKQASIPARKCVRWFWSSTSMGGCTAVLPPARSVAEQNKSWSRSHWTSGGTLYQPLFCILEVGPGFDRVTHVYEALPPQLQWHQVNHHNRCAAQQQNNRRPSRAQLLQLRQCRSFRF